MGCGRSPPSDFPNPARPVHVTQSAGSFFEIGLELIDRVAELLVASGLHLDERLQKSAAILLDQPGRSQSRIRPQSRDRPRESAIEKGGVRLHLRFIEFLEVIARADLVSDFELQIPQRMQDGFDRFFVDVVLEEEQQVDIGFRMDRLSSVASDGKQRKRIWRLAVAPEVENDLVDFRPDRLFNTGSAGIR